MICRFDMQSENGLISHTQAQPESKKKKRSNGTGVRKKELKSDLCQFLDFGSKTEIGRVELILPLRTVSEANCFEPWQKKHKRHKAQKKAAFFAILEFKHLIKLPCRLTYVRYAPKLLDKHDNLPISMKYLNDQICAEITNDHRPGRADDNELIEIKYDQVKSKVYGVKIIIEF